MRQKFILTLLAAAMALASAAHASTGYTVLYNFCPHGSPCVDGQWPGGLVADSTGELYGTTYFGGKETSECNNSGCGTVFRVSPSGTETVLYSFCQQANCSDGSIPGLNLLRDSSGNFYGTTGYGGANGAGTVFKLAANGTETVLFSFCTSCDAGQNPNSGVIMDGSGNLYGTAPAGGASSCGVVFKLDSKGNQKVLHSFGSQTADGCKPVAVPLMDGKGNLYGTTQQGGSANGGTIFEITSGGSYGVLYSFCSRSGCTDGEEPDAPLIEDKTGNLYGTTSSGGKNGYGTAFSLASTGHEKVLHAFGKNLNSTDGRFPFGGLLELGKALYGTTGLGGTSYAGVVFRISRGKTKSIHEFDSTHGYLPDASLIAYQGWIYGTTQQGGAYGDGVVFKLGTKGGVVR